MSALVSMSTPPRKQVSTSNPHRNREILEQGKKTQSRVSVGSFCKHFGPRSVHFWPGALWTPALDKALCGFQVIPLFKDVMSGMAWFGLAWLVLLTVPSSIVASPPNILFMMTDQHRGDVLGVAGNSQAKTPNLDRLAQQGVVSADHEA